MARSHTRGDWTPNGCHGGVCRTLDLLSPLGWDSSRVGNPAWCWCPPEQRGVGAHRNSTALVPTGTKFPRVRGYSGLQGPLRPVLQGVSCPLPGCPFTAVWFRRRVLPGDRRAGPSAPPPRCRSEHARVVDSSVGYQKMLLVSATPGGPGSPSTGGSGREPPVSPDSGVLDSYKNRSLSNVFACSGEI